MISTIYDIGEIMVVSKQQKTYIISLTQQALSALKNNQFDTAESFLRSATGELHEINMLEF